MNPIFNEPYYKANKVVSLNNSGEAHSGVEAGQWTIADLDRVLDSISMTYLQHYIQFGAAEGVSPYTEFIELVYLENKARSSNINGESHSGIPIYGWTAENMKTVLAMYGMNPLYHYEFFGKAEGISLAQYDPMAIGIVAGNSFRFAGSIQCLHLHQKYIDVLEKVSLSISRDNPLSKQLIMGDACPVSGNCPGHPTHGNLTEIDIDYPTYSGKGTQYGAPTEDIWINTDPLNMILDESKVDWWTTWQLIIRVKSELPDIQTQIILHKKVFDLIGKNISVDELNELRVMTNQDEGIQFNHPWHMHFRMAEQ